MGYGDVRAIAGPPCAQANSRRMAEKQGKEMDGDRGQVKEAGET
jgi:hypothetical protein